MSAAAALEVVVVGAGPYGLSISAHLAARGVPHRVFGRPMSAWRSNMPEGMYLKSSGMASSLSDPVGGHTLREYCRITGQDYSDWGRPISRDLFAEYGDWFQRRLVPAVDTREVLACERDADGFVVRLRDGEGLRARSVVISSGYVASARVPEELVGLGSALVSHSSEHPSLTGFRGQDVIVVGGGQSALESAALLREAGARPIVVARRAVRWGEPETGQRPLLERLLRPRTALSFGWKYAFFEHPSLAFHGLPLSVRKRQVDTTLGPLGAWWLRERVEGRLPVHSGWRVHEAVARDGRAVLRFRREGEALELGADHVIAATGYRMSAQSFPFLSGELKRDIAWEHGFPILSRNFESSVAGLHFIGLASAYAFGPVMRFVAGARLMAPRLSALLAARHLPASASVVGAPPVAQQAA